MTPGLRQSPRLLHGHHLIGATIALGFCLEPIACIAADWTLEAGFSQKIDYDTNINLEIDPPGYALGSISTLNANLFARTPTSRFDLISNLAYQAYTGPGATSELDAFLPVLETKYEVKSRDTELDLGASYVVQSITAGNIDETGLIQETGVNQHTFTVQGGITHRIDNINKIALNSIASKVDFTPSSGNVVPYHDLDNTLTFGRALSPTMDGDLSFGIEFYEAQDELNTLNTIYSAEASINSQLTRRLTLRLGAGVNAVESKQDRLESSDKNFDVGPLFNLGLDYRMKRSSISLDISEEFTPTDSGEIDEVRQVSLTAQHQFNEASTLGVAFVYSEQAPASGQPGDGGADPTTAFSLSPTFTYQMARDWQMQLGYRLLTEKIDGGNPTSNDFYITLTRNLVVIP